MALFEGTGLACERGGRTVFSGLRFAAPAGGVLLLAGANGSGKSSLLRLMAGLATPAAGTLSWAGTAIADDPDGHRARLAWVGHADAVKPVLTVARNLADWAALAGAAGTLRPGTAIDTALAAVGLGRLGPIPARHLSAGQRRRLALARLALSAAPLWLLDEPTTALDEDGVARLAGLLDGHCAGGGIVIAATHGGALAAALTAPVATLALEAAA